MNTNYLIKSFLGHTRRVTCFALDTKTNRLFTGSSDTTIKIWNINTGVCIQTLRAQTTVNGLKVLYNRLASISLDRTLKIWDITENVRVNGENGEPIQGTCLNTFYLICRPLCLTQITSGHIVIGSDSGQILIKDINDGNMYYIKVEKV